MLRKGTEKPRARYFLLTEKDQPLVSHFFNFTFDAFASKVELTQKPFTSTEDSVLKNTLPSGLGFLHPDRSKVHSHHDVFANSFYSSASINTDSYFYTNGVTAYILPRLIAF